MTKAELQKLVQIAQENIIGLEDRHDLAIYLTDDDTFSVRGIIEEDGLSFDDLEALLTELGEDE